MSQSRQAGTAKGDEAHEAHGDLNPASESNMSRDIINIPDNVLQNGIREYDEAAQDAIQWLFTYGRTELENSRDRLCEAVDADWTTIVRIAQGKYPAAIDSFVEKILDLQRRVNEAGSSKFVETLVTGKIFSTLDYALAGDVDGGRVVLIAAPARRGKTAAVREWCRRNNHGRSVYIDAPVSGGLRALAVAISDATGINSGRKTSDILERIEKSFHRRRILIVDEIARLIPPRWGDRVVCLEFLRRLHDVTGCALALIATPVVPGLLQSGPLKEFLEQLFERVKEPLVIPKTVFLKEARQISEAFCSKPSQAFVALAHKIANEPGKLDLLYELLRQAAMLAKRRGDALSETHLAAAYQRRRDRLVWPTEKGE